MSKVVMNGGTLPCPAPVQPPFPAIQASYPRVGTVAGSHGAPSLCQDKGNQSSVLVKGIMTREKRKEGRKNPPGQDGDKSQNGISHEPFSAW